MSNICGSAATPNDHEPAGNACNMRARAALEQMWAAAPAGRRHILTDGRRAVLTWTDQGTSLVLIDWIRS